MSSKGQSWRQRQSYAERQKSYENCRTWPNLQVSGEQISSVSQVQNFHPNGRRPCGRGDAESEMTSSFRPHNLPLRIPYKDIHSQITTRADTECPRPPPNIPPRPNNYAFQCGDFTYEIPIDDPYTLMLFE